MGLPVSTTLGVFGYLPGQSDFVRVRAAGREVRRLEDWLEKGLHQVRWAMGGGFSVAYPRLYHRFVFRPDNSEQTLIGVLCGSMDCHKRPFPFVAFDLVPTRVWDRDPVDLLSQNEAFFAALERLLRAVATTSHVGQVHSQVLALPAPLWSASDKGLGAAPTPPVTAHQQARYGNFLHETVCADLGSPDTSGRSGRLDASDTSGTSGASGLPGGLSICHSLIGLLGNLQDPRLLRQALELPLCRPLFARELELRFYLSLCLTLLAERRPTLTLFWQLGDATPGSLFASFREPTLDLFSALLRPVVPARGVYLPGTHHTDVPLLRPLPEWTGETSLHTLLQELSQAGGAGQHRGRKSG